MIEIIFVIRTRHFVMTQSCQATGNYLLFFYDSVDIDTMFPNFTSLAQREQKRQELLEKYQRRVRQANAKREMYEGASWASDISNGLSSIAKKSTESTQTNMSVGPDQPIPTEVKQTINDIIDQAIAQSDLKSLSDENSDINPEVSTPSMINVGSTAKPDTTDAEVHVRPDTADRGFQARPDTTDRNIQAQPTTSDVGVDNSVRMTDVSINVKPSTIDAETNTPRKPARLDTEEQVASREWIKAFYKKLLIGLRFEFIRLKRKILKTINAMLSVKTGRLYREMVKIQTIRVY
jgi:hypothetical protein